MQVLCVVLTAQILVRPSGWKDLVLKPGSHQTLDLSNCKWAGGVVWSEELAPSA